MRERVRLTLGTRLDLGVEPERLVAQASFYYFFKTHKRAAANEKNVCCIDREEFLMRMLASALRRNIRDRPFENFKKRLLHAFAGNIASDGRVFILAAYLVDLIDVDDTLLRALDIAVGGLQKFQDDVLDIFTDITRFGQRRRINDREWHAQHPRQRL